MKILGIESSSIAASCAIVEDNTLLGEFTLNHKLTHSEKLMPLIENLMSSLDINISDIDLIAIDEGPGSYTGLRIGAAIAKGLAFKDNIPLVNIASTEALANNIKTVDIPIAVLIDARGDRVFHGIYVKKGDEMEQLEEIDAGTIQEFLATANEKYREMIFTGDGAMKHESLITEIFGNKAFVADEYDSIIKAWSLCVLGYRKFLKGLTINSKDFSPNYLRPSQAERNLKKD
ncbi:tRNA threonylcarbamoyl adenosine modification protein YeaZ [Dethiosulfatibacter aminovorans DSM 17477]|uniref:tRNA threonylcarbamoyl adenosine modification protein YeaZ n=1 Tax=Dethiosulfatibacter aminovorans DSM 17477 TaxID=1121476 RepID=A0A1M6D1H2_9FIRM|nr:tRNA (adenosine(37)-N6)-threonylcarbamoyltransferase complex dimerization subunit type 1 TsaB [Dethiosulfatibacter aminovorans]SHI67080.1 tRNA threonylcarbamoyl adenosine modification protein YeaZ [Dethiosulfatibacter aminovorans DSM 17477]